MLFVEGSPSWEYKYLKQAMERDPAVEFYGMVRLPGDEWIYQGHPNRPDEDGRPGKPVIASPKDGFPTADELNFFDVLIVGDLERKIFERENRYEIVDSFVRNHGGGMVTIGGFQVYSAGDYAGTPLAHMLPVSPGHRREKEPAAACQPVHAAGHHIGVDASHHAVGV